MSELIIPELKGPFAFGDHSISFPDALFDGTLAIPSSQGGTLLNRHVLNGIGFMGTIGLFLDLIGYPYSLPVGAYIEGYMDQAVKRGRGHDGRLREYVNSITDNTNEPPFSESEDPEGTGANGWTHTQNYKDSYSFPSLDLSVATVIYSGIKTDDEEFSVDFQPQKPGTWIYVKRVITGWSDLSDSQKMSIGPQIEIQSLSYDLRLETTDAQAYSDSIPFFEGPETGRLFPSCAGQRLRISIAAKSDTEPSAQSSTVDGETISGYGSIEIEVRELTVQA